MAKPGRPKKATVPADFYIGFNGTSPQVNVTEPKLGQIVEYTVRGEVRKVEDVLRDDGETRSAIRVKPLEVWPAGANRPDSANQSLMFDHAGNPTDEATQGDADVEASADEGDEILAMHNEAKAAKAAAAEGEGEVDEFDQDDPRNETPPHLKVAK